MPTVAEEVERYIEQGYFPEDVTPTRATLSRKPRFPWSMFVWLTVLFGLLSTAGLVTAWMADPSSSLLVSLLFIWGVTAVLFFFVSGWYWVGRFVLGSTSIRGRTERFSCARRSSAYTVGTWSLCLVVVAASTQKSVKLT